MEWIRCGALHLRHIDTADIPAITEVLEQYAEHSIDLADACMVWLADVEKCNRVLTTDRRDFDMLRTASGQAFERIWVGL